MNRFFLLLPLLALVAAPVLADDPATNAAGFNLESVEPHLGVEVFPLSHVLASDMVVELKRALPEKGVSLGKGAIQVDERSNALLVMAPASSMGAIRETVSALDVLPTFVSCRIEALEMPAEAIPAALAQNGIVPAEASDGLRGRKDVKCFFCPTTTTQDGKKASLALSDEIKNEEGETIQSDSFTVCVTPVVLDGGKISLTVSAEHMIDGAPAQNLEESTIETGPGEAAVFPMPGREGKRILLFAAPSVFDLAALDEPTLPAGGTWEPASPASRLNPATNAPAETETHAENAENAEN
ncbi:MAG: hypothetical protein II839_09350 [Kiritimatiellae bacterium]|nr:hypothetical protein [Kiritimatiellia bacterium]